MKTFSRMNAGEQVALIGRNSALNGEERPKLKSKALQEISDKAFEDALEEWAEANATGNLNTDGTLCDRHDSRGTLADSQDARDFYAA